MPLDLGEGAGAASAEFVIVQRLTYHEAEWDAVDYWAGNLAGVDPLT